MNCCYVHQLPGRLRVRLPITKGNPALAEKLASRIHALEGITSVAANPVTGSLLIRYDVSVTNAAACFDVLRIRRNTKMPRRTASNMVETAMWIVFEKIVERLILAALF